LRARRADPLKPRAPRPITGLPMHVVRPSHAGHTGAARKQAPATPDAHAGGSPRAFATLLANAASVPTASSPAASTGGTGTTAPTTAAPPAIHLRKGESTTDVAGHAYAEIHGGARDGMFVNTSANKRRGEAFTLVHRDGREVHVYGSGKNRLVVYVSPPRNPATPPEPIKLRDGETMTPVPGHHYAQIHGGPRDGMLINTSLNKRRGQTFLLVHKDGADYHVYGSGKDRKVIKVVPHDPGATASAAPATS
jgi:hypothetical protein